MRERKGRMINKDISNSKRFASLSPEAAVLFAMLIPHYNSHGKLNGGSGYIKDEICPHVSYLNSETIPVLLAEISEKTNVKWFERDGRYWIHSINFLTDHQELDPKRLGKDSLPDYSETCQKQVLPEVEVEVKEKEKAEKVKKNKTGIPEGFSISENVKKWAKEKGYSQLDEHLDAFKRKVAARGYKYIDWDAAFMEAVRENWAKLKGVSNSKPQDASGRDLKYV